jgi:hypothetical protein
MRKNTMEPVTIKFVATVRKVLAALNFSVSSTPYLYPAVVTMPSASEYT